MKVFTGLALVVMVVGLAIWWWQPIPAVEDEVAGISPDPQMLDKDMQQQQPHSETPTSDSAVDAPEKQQVTSATKPALDPEEARILRDKAQALRTEIDELILKLDSNLADREARSELKQRIGVLTEQYNALVLPLAMEAMQRGS